MGRFRPIIVFGYFAMLAAAVGACASTGDKSHYQNAFSGDPMIHLIGTWEGKISFAGETRGQSTERTLTIFHQEAKPSLLAYYSIPGTRHGGYIRVTLEQDSDRVSISFRTGAGSRIKLWLQRMGDDLVLNGEIRTTMLPHPMLLRKKK